MTVGTNQRPNESAVLRSGMTAPPTDEFRLAIDTIPGLVWTALPDGNVDFLNQRWCDYTGLSPEAAAGLGWQSTIHPQDLPALVDYWRALLASREPGQIEARLRRHDGVHRWFLFRAIPLINEHGAVVKWYGQTTDIDERKKAETLLAGEKRLLEMIARGDSLLDVLDALCRVVEETTDGALCSILLVDPNGTQLRHAAAPSIPLSYTSQIDGSTLAEGVGPCATAAILRQQVVAPDFAIDDGLWPDEYRTRALAHGLRACWSTTIESSAGEVLGTFALYFRTPGRPRSDHQAAIEQYSHIASIAIQSASNREALRESEERFRRMADTIDDVIWITSLEPEAILYVSPSFERIWGLPIEALIRNPRLWTETIHDDDRARVIETFTRWIAGEQVNYHDVEFRIAHPAGTTRWIHERGVLTRGEDGKPRLLSGISSDITARKLAEEELRRSEANLARAQRLSATGSFSYVVEANELTLSEETYRIYELDPATRVTPQMARDFVHPEDLPAFRQLLSGTGEDFSFESRVLLPTGKTKHLQISASAIRDRSGRLVEWVGAVRDITERRVADDALQETRAALAHVSRVATLGELTASIAHEVNQPLAAVVMNNNACLRWLAASPPDVHEAQESARRTGRDAQRAADVIARLQGLFRKAAGARVPLDMNDALNDVLALAHNEFQRKRVVLRTELAEGLPAVMGDRVQLQQVALNLVVNAADAMATVDRPREITVATAIGGNDTVRVSVRDAGIGLAGADIERIFEPFVTSKAWGMGMGLSIARSIIEVHGGRLWATANEGPGATFQFTVPRFVAAEGASDRP